MRITKYPQSCLFVEAAGVKLLFDPGNLKYDPRFLEVFSTADAVFITHKHADHCFDGALLALAPKIPVYMTRETSAAHPRISGRRELIAEGDEVEIGGVRVRAVRAVHGYHPKMRGNEVYENVGYTADDGRRRLYVTSDTICFPSGIRADLLAMPVTGYGVTMSAFEASLFAKETGAKQVLLTHMDNPAFEPSWSSISRYFDGAGVNYTILTTGEHIETG